jgi:hypothetical protein
MKKQTALIRLLSVRWSRASVNGNPRWAFTGVTVNGQPIEMKTATDSNCAYACNIGRLRSGSVLRVVYHETAAGHLIADRWEDSRLAGLDLENIFKEGYEITSQEPWMALTAAEASNLPDPFTAKLTEGDL